jgi:uncharacterized integral membrane protein (TIGR00697 family)
MMFSSVESPTAKRLKSPYRTLLIVSGAYVAAQMLADIGSLRIVAVAGYAVDAGTLIYPLTFTLRDLVHKVGGKTAARTLIFLAAVINIVMAGFFWVTARLPPDQFTGPQTEFGEVLSPVWGIVAASIIAEVVSELIDTAVYGWWVARFGERRQWGRVLVSNAIAIPIDSALFVGLATLFGVFPPEVAWSILGVNVIFKGVVTLVSIPSIYWVKPTPLRLALDPDDH